MNTFKKLISAVILRISSFMRSFAKNKPLLRVTAFVLALVMALGSMGESYAPFAIAAQEAGYENQSIELYPEGKKADKTVTLNGLMPKDATADAVDVTDDYSGGSESAALSDNNASASVIAAYDITIKDGKKDYQPDKTRPIQVEITHPDLSADRAIIIWHIKDDGSKEKVKNYKLDDGRVTFDATGFSVYAIVDVNEPFEFESAANTDELVGSRAAQSGLCLFYGDGKYFKNTLNGNGCLDETTDVEQAALWYFERPDSTKNEFKIYTYVGGNKKYIHNSSGNMIELSDTADMFEISLSPTAHAFYLKKKGESKWLQHSNGGGGIRYYTDNKNTVNPRIKAAYADSLILPDDYYGLDGKSYGIMNYQGGTVGNAFIADSGAQNYLSMITMTVRQDNKNNVLYVAEDSDITKWTFNWVSDVSYTISTTVNGETKYLKMGSDLSLVSESEATAFEVSSNKNNQLQLSSNGKSITFGNNGFTVANTSTGSNQLLNLVDTAGISSEDYITYTSSKVSVSDVPDAAQVIVYTRVWDNERKQYDFYAIDHDGTLHPCYERGDHIMWVGNQINTLLWEFTEYHYDDGTPNYYYELYNPYSEKYIAPQINGGQTLSDNKIGINLPGRRDGEYYSDILAWDDPYYAYAGLQSDITNGIITSGTKTNADTFYFAVVESPTPTLTAVDTIDNNDYGITMKMIDFPVQPNKETGEYYQNDFLGTGAQSSNAPTKGLLSTKIDPATGYPTVRSGASLGQLFNGATEVNHLFVESTYRASGYFEFDSCQNFATLVKPDGTIGTDFTVYKEIGTTDQFIRSTLKHGQFMPYNSITAGRYAVNNPENLYSALALPDSATAGLLSDDDPRKYEKLHLVNGTPNYYNGMELSAKFVKSPKGKDDWGHDIIFEFTGDDDFWLYVDGELVIDLGGIHSALAGSVNFSTGEVVVNGVHSNLRTVFENNYRTRNPGATNAEVEAFLDEYFEPGENVFKDYTAYDMKVYYMERGAGASNLHMRFNPAYVTPGSVLFTKEVSGSDDVDFNLVEYPYQIWYIDEQTGEEKLLGNDNNHINVTYQNSTQRVEFVNSYTPPNSTETFQNVYFLNPEMTAEIHYPANTIQYKIVECGINNEVYDEVLVNGVEVHYDPQDTNARKSFDSGWLSVLERPSITFNNHVNPNALRTLSVQKILLDEEDNVLSAEDDPTTFSFRLYLSNGSDDVLTLANMQKYYVADPEGHLCLWDSQTQGFTPTNKTDYASLTDAEKEQYTFETSMNGSISKIPAGYTVEVPNLTVGTRFMIVERDYEIPTGYTFVKYERDAGTYNVQDGDTLNSGWVRANESPKMFVYNKRGWGLEVNKIWSDKSYTTSHGDIYTAVYIGNTLVPDTVRRIRHPDTSVRYYFEELMPGADFDDYTVYEVELENPVVDSDGNVTSYSSITRLREGEDELNVSAVSKKTGVANNYSYSVDYDVGTPVSTAGEYLRNIRTDTITNSRTGGIAITLYDMHTGDPLQNGTFTLMQGTTKLGTFTSDSDGRITVLYDFEYDTDYTLTQTASPEGYIGLPNSAVFSFNDDNTVNISGNESKWQTGYKSTVTGDKLVAYIDVFNEPYTFKVVKEDRDTHDPLSGAHFALYKSVKGLGGQVKDTKPLRGYEDLVTGVNGIVPKLDNTLPAGRYYLTEVSPPANYNGLDSDIIFTLSDDGVITVNDGEHENLLTQTGTTQKDYTLTVPNIYNATAELTVSKTVRGNLADRQKSFEFTVTVTGAAQTDEYIWYKNGTLQAENLHSGSTFTLANGENVNIVLPINKEITVSENNGDYTTEFKLDGVPMERTNTKTFILSEDKELDVVNIKNGVIPTGVYITATGIAGAIMISLCTASAVILLRKKRYNAE